MWAYLQHLSFWDWLALGALLLILEVFGAGGYLLWMGLAAAGVGIASYLFPQLGWAWQFILFGALALSTLLFWWQHQRHAMPRSEQPGLNQRGQELIGRTFILHEAIGEGHGKIRVGDGLWLVSGPPLAVGQAVQVVAQDGVILQVKAAQAPDSEPSAS